jgi:predicted phosphohydrolase
MNLKEDIIKRLGSDVVNVDYWPNGIVKYRTWYRNGVCIKSEEYGEHGMVKVREWMNGGHFFSREEYDENGDRIYYEDGKDFP